MDTTVQTARHAFVNELTTGLKNPSGKRVFRLFIKKKKTGDYHEEMNAAVFENWFSDILPRLEEDAVVGQCFLPKQKIRKHSEYRNKKGRHSENSSYKQLETCQLITGQWLYNIQ
jgi:hypothetical protein